MLHARTVSPHNWNITSLQSSGNSCNGVLQLPNLRHIHHETRAKGSFGQDYIVCEQFSSVTVGQHWLWVNISSVWVRGFPVLFRWDCQRVLANREGFFVPWASKTALGTLNAHWLCGVVSASSHSSPSCKFDISLDWTQLKAVLGFSVVVFG